VSYRQYAPGQYGGIPAPFSTIKERRALIGKRVGYDRRGSIMLNRGTVTDAEGRNIKIDDSWFDKNEIEKIEVLP